jgi:hypothetical protein
MFFANVAAGSRIPIDVTLITIAVLNLKRTRPCAQDFPVWSWGNAGY